MLQVRVLPGLPTESFVERSFDGARGPIVGSCAEAFSGVSSARANKAMTNNRIVQISYVALAVVSGFFLEHVLLALFGLFSATQPLTTSFSQDSGYSWCAVLGLGLAFAIAAYLYRAPRSHEV